MNYLKEELYGLIKTDDQVFDFLQDSTLDGLWYWDLEDQEQEWMSKQFWLTLGYDPNEMPHLASAWQDIIHPEDLADAIVRVGKHIEDPSFPYDQIVRYRHKMGRTVYIRCRGLAIRDENGKAKRMLGAHIDVTKEKEREALLHRSQEIARIGTWSINLSEGSVHWDSVTRKIHEVDENYQPSLDNGITFYKEGSSRETIVRLVDLAIKDGKSFDTELQLVTQKGREIWVRAIGQADFYEDKCVRVYGVFQDIDERRRNEDKMLSYSVLEAKGKEMEQFTYIASHDLREPLLTIKGYLNVIQEDYFDQLPAEVLNYMKTITDAAERMDVLMQGLLDYSRLSQIKKIQEVDLQEVMKDVLVDLSSATHGLDIKYTYSDLPLVIGYPLELKILLQNLVGNAIKYRQADRPLEVAIECESTSNGWKIRVSDNGIGIAEKDLNDIFQLFRQLHSPGIFTGSGIGLANCKKITELHRGEIWAKSKLGEGSDFYFTINTRE